MRSPGLQENRILNQFQPSSLIRRPRIGVFDSGVGGLSVWREVVARLPGESTVYIADAANCPYGRRDASELTALSKRLVRALLGEGCGLIVVACNTATAAAIDALREAFDVPIVGMEPAVKPAGLDSRSGVIGVLATAGTCNGRLFRETCARILPPVRCVVRTGDDLVALVESGRAETDSARIAVEAHLRPMLAEGIDGLALGCTHFSFLAGAIRAVAGAGLRVFDPSSAVARQVERKWEACGFPPAGGVSGSHVFATTGDPGVFRGMVEGMGWKTRDGFRPLRELEGSRVFLAERA